jgi:hypothetical protein
MKAWILPVAGAALLVLSGSWYIGSPWVTLYGIRTAIENRDVEAMIGYVDFDALRQNLKDQARAAAPPSAPRTDASGWSLPTPPATQLAAIEQQIDLYVTPESARAMFARAGGGSTFDRPARIGDVAEIARDIAIDRKGMGTFVVRGKNTPVGVGFVFTAHGLGWKLSGISLPAGMTQAIGKRSTTW